MKVIFKFVIHLLIVLLFTIVSQIGGVTWILSMLTVSALKFKKKWTVPTFLALYFAISFLIVPSLASLDGRVPLPIFKSGNIVPHNLITIVFNRHYVKEDLLTELKIISKIFERINPDTKPVYLDANFPFIDGFPLLPHRSHNDGRKIDLAFIYTKNGNASNAKPSRSGYGYFEAPNKGEYNQPKVCIGRGYWQYDFTKYLTLGSSDNFELDTDRTKALMQVILNRPKTHKVFIEPHLKTRLQIDHVKCRFHGCKAVRHDDHIHYQI